MAWVTLTAADIEDRLSEPELDAVRSYDLASGQGDPTPEVIALTVAEVRGYIPITCLDPDTTLIPPELKDTAIVVAIEKLAGRLSGGGCIMQEDRQRSFEYAMQRLRDTARGQFFICSAADTDSDLPADVDNEVSGGNAAMLYGGDEKLDF